MQRILALIIIFLGGCALQAQVPIWMGFSQEWGYNHRIKRLGDWVEASPDDARPGNWRHVHSAASGSGADRGTYLSRLARVEGDSLFFHSGSVELDILGKEKEEIELSQKVKLPDLPGREQVLLLNGFDLYTPGASKADKFEYFEVRADSLLREGGQLYAVVQARLRLACSSPECQAFNNDVEYRLRLQYLLVSGNFRYERQNFNTFQSWDRQEALEFAPIPCEFPLQSEADAVVPAFQSIKLELDDEHHILDWASYLTPADRVRSSRTTLTLGYRQWDEGMYDAFKQNYNHGKIKIPAKWAVQKQKGWAAMGASVVMLYFERAKVGYYEVEGEFEWETTHKDQQPADGSLAETRRDLW